MQNKKFNLQKVGGILCIYAGAAYLAMIIFFLGIVDYTSITDAGEKIQMFASNQSGFYIIYLLGYVIFGLALVMISIALYERLKDASGISKATAVYGIIWATLLIGAGTLFNRGIIQSVGMYATDPDKAIALWNATEAAALSLSFADGEILGGVWTLLVSIAAIKTNNFNKGANYLGIVVGSAGILSAVPFINAAGGTALFGIGQLIWLIWIGIIKINKNQILKQN